MADRELSRDEMQPLIGEDLQPILPSVDSRDLERQVSEALDNFGYPPVKQFLPLLVARQVRELHR